MNRETGVWLAVALLSIGTLGISATTIESTVTTEPDDVIDFNYDTVPIGQDDAQTILDEMAAADSETNGDVEKPKPEDGSGDRTKSKPDESSDTTDDVSKPPDSNDEDGNAPSNEEMGPDVTPPEPSLLDRLLDLLAALVPYLLFVAAVCGAAGLTVRYRDRILGLFDDPAPPVPVDDSPSSADDWLDGPPSNAVDRVWVELIDELDLERPTTMTPRECAAVAIEEGFDREVVHRLTESFEEVRYGGQPATDHREQFARSSRRQLDLEEKRQLDLGEVT